MERLLRYPDHTAGGIMTTEFVRLDPAMTVGDALKHIRQVAREKESIFSCYVMEPDTGRLLGSVSLRDLVMAELGQPVTEVMRRKPITVNAQDDQEEVAQKIAKYNLLAVPVLEKDGRMVGFVTVDDVIDVLIEESHGGRAQDGGRERGRRRTPLLREPLPPSCASAWAGCSCCSWPGPSRATVLRHYEGELAAVVALSFFIPLLIGTGRQRRLAGRDDGHPQPGPRGDPAQRHAWRVVVKEASVGAFLGPLIGAVAFGRALGSGGHHAARGRTVALAMVAICVWSTTVGSVIPIVAQRFGVDPAVLSAPLITTLVDATGLVIYFEIARAVLRL